jgi:hypothetical protein
MKLFFSKDIKLILLFLLFQKVFSTVGTPDYIAPEVFG